MKKALIVLFLLSYTKIYSQERALFITDSLLKTNNVKSRTKRFTANNLTSYNVDHYNKDGKLIRGEVITPINDIPLIITNYFYDSLGRIYASVVYKTEKYFSKLFLFDAYDTPVQSLTSYYEYGKSNVLERTYLLDSINKVNFECIYTNNPTVMDKKWYDKKGRLTKESIDSLERGIFIIKSTHKYYDTSGIQTLELTETYENKYNKDGQLIETFFKNDKCNSPKTYEYYKNGLLKKKKGDKCLPNWKIIYKYY